MLSARKAVELHLLQREMPALRHKVAPLPSVQARDLHQELLTKARRRPTESCLTPFSYPPDPHVR